MGYSAEIAGDEYEASNGFDDSFCRYLFVFCVFWKNRKERNLIGRRMLRGNDEGISKNANLGQLQLASIPGFLPGLIDF